MNEEDMGINRVSKWKMEREIEDEAAKEENKGSINISEREKREIRKRKEMRRNKTTN